MISALICALAFIICLFVGASCVTLKLNKNACYERAERFGFEKAEYKAWSGECFVLKNGKWTYPYDTTEWAK